MRTANFRAEAKQQNQVGMLKLAENVNLHEAIHSSPRRCTTDFIKPNQHLAAVKSWTRSSQALSYITKDRSGNIWDTHCPEKWTEPTGDEGGRKKGTHLLNHPKEAEPITRLRTPEFAAYRTSASATPSPSSTTVSTCAGERTPRRDPDQITGNVQRWGFFPFWGGLGELTVAFAAAKMRRKGRSASCARAWRSRAYASAASRATRAAGTCSPPSPPPHTTPRAKAKKPRLDEEEARRARALTWGGDEPERGDDVDDGNGGCGGAAVSVSSGDEVGGGPPRGGALPPGRTATATAAGDGGRGSPEAMGIEAEAEAAIARWFKATREIRWLRAGVSGVGEELAQLTSITMGFGGRGWARSDAHKDMQK
uniref:Uncharacterized protein n=1 Tax=Oryza rufipogon TaxID=4529 RepID=A0A0E0NBS3_ORYRU